VSKIKSQSIVRSTTEPYFPSLSLTANVISMRADEAARLTGATICFIEEQMREGSLPFVWMGKRRIIFYDDLLHWARKLRSDQPNQNSARGDRQ
jgi:excisionase family DNA binding protein